MEPLMMPTSQKKPYKSFEAEPRVAFLLGFQGNMEDNSFEVCHSATKKKCPKRTQQVVLSFVASVFDPLGIFAPLTRRVKILHQVLWSKLCQLWDEDIPKDNEVCFED